LPRHSSTMKTTSSSSERGSNFLDRLPIVPCNVGE
jgi:hypothetical protein